MYHSDNQLLYYSLLSNNIIMQCALTVLLTILVYALLLYALKERIYAQRHTYGEELSVTPVIGAMKMSSWILQRVGV